MIDDINNILKKQNKDFLTIDVIYIAEFKNVN